MRISSLIRRLVVPSIAANARATARYGAGLPSGQSTARTGCACTAGHVRCGPFPKSIRPLSLNASRRPAPRHHSLVRTRTKGLYRYPVSRLDT